MRRKSKRETKAIWSEIRAGVLRRTNSVEDVSDNINQESFEQSSVEITKSGQLFKIFT